MLFLFNNWKYKTPAGHTIGGPIYALVHLIFDLISKQGFLSNTAVLKQLYSMMHLLMENGRLF